MSLSESSVRVDTLVETLLFPLSFTLFLPWAMGKILLEFWDLHFMEWGGKVKKVVSNMFSFRICSTGRVRKILVLLGNRNWIAFLQLVSIVGHFPSVPKKCTTVSKYVYILFPFLSVTNWFFALHGCNVMDQLVLKIEISLVVILLWAEVEVIFILPPSISLCFLPLSPSLFRMYVASMSTMSCQPRPIIHLLEKRKKRHRLDVSGRRRISNGIFHFDLFCT